MVELLHVNKIKVCIVVKTAPQFNMIKGKGGLINGKISWIIISFDKDKIDILLLNKNIIKYNL